MNGKLKQYSLGLVYIVSLLLGVVLWVGVTTDFSWNNDTVNLFYAPFVGLFGLASLFLIRQYDNENLNKKYYYLLPSLFGGVPYIVFVILASCFLIPFATLGISEEKEKTIIQQEFSPNKLLIAEAYFYDNGTFEGNGNLVSIQVKYKNIPFIRRDISSTSISEFYEYPGEYFQWDSDSKIVIQEPYKGINVSTVKFKWPIIPLIFLVPYAIYLLIKSGYNLIRQEIKYASTI